MQDYMKFTGFTVKHHSSRPISLGKEVCKTVILAVDGPSKKKGAQKTVILHFQQKDVDDAPLVIFGARLFAEKTFSNPRSDTQQGDYATLTCKEWPEHNILVQKGKTYGSIKVIKTLIEPNTTSPVLYIVSGEEYILTIHYRPLDHGDEKISSSTSSSMVLRRNHMMSSSSSPPGAPHRIHLIQGLYRGDIDVQQPTTVTFELTNVKAARALGRELQQKQQEEEEGDVKRIKKQTPKKKKQYKTQDSDDDDDDDTTIAISDSNYESSSDEQSLVGRTVTRSSRHPYKLRDFHTITTRKTRSKYLASKLATTLSSFSSSSSSSTPSLHRILVNKEEESLSQSQPPKIRQRRLPKNATNLTREMIQHRVSTVGLSIETANEVILSRFGGLSMANTLLQVTSSHDVDDPKNGSSSSSSWSAIKREIDMDLEPVNDDNSAMSPSLSPTTTLEIASAASSLCGMSNHASTSSSSSSSSSLLSMATNNVSIAIAIPNHNNNTKMMEEDEFDLKCYEAIDDDWVSDKNDDNSLPLPPLLELPPPILPVLSDSDDRTCSLFLHPGSFL